MLTNIRIKNAYSIKEANLNLNRGKFTYKKEMVEDDVVSPIVFYGNNGSGKTSIVNTLNDLLNLLITDKDNFYPFIANFNFKNEDSFIELTFKLEGDEYKYAVVTSFSDSMVVQEELLVNGNAVFTRNKEVITIEDLQVKVDRPLLLALRQLYSFKDELKETKKEIVKAYNYLINMSIIKGEGNLCNSKFCNYKNMEDLILENSQEIKRVLSKYKEFPLFDFYREGDNEYLNVNFENNNKVKLPGFLISDGMYTMLKIMAILINSEEGSILVIDGVEKNLHLTSINLIIKEAKKRGIQLIFTSHNTSLMQSLRPDQIYFAKYKNGVSYYFRLANIYDNIRKINNIEKMYLSNTFNESINSIINVED